MKKCPNSSRSPAWLSILVGTILLAGCGRSAAPKDESHAAPTPRLSMKLTSNAFEDGQPLPADYTCDGAGQSPALQWSEPPAGTQSFALVVADPDAPGGAFDHWGVYDIPMSARQIDTGAAQRTNSGLKQTTNGFGKSGYGPPCPPKGDKPHHYHFRLMALDIPQLAKVPASVSDIGRAADGHVLGSAELVALYGRK